MDDSLSQQFFLEPRTPLQRRYEALRAVILERQPLTEVAPRFGYAYGTLRNLVSQFRGQCRAKHVPPFLPRRPVDDRPAVTTACDRKHQPLPIAGYCRSVANAPCARVWLASSCSGPCWPNSASTASSSRPAIQVPR